MDTRYPSGETVFECSVDPRNKGWLAWEARLPQGAFKPPADVPAYRCAALAPPPMKLGRPFSVHFH
jgi:hypothetical protein